MTKHIRGWRQLKALFIFIEQLWVFLIGQDSRGLDEEEKEFVVYSGREFRQDRFKCMKRELEIFVGVAKPYKVVFAPTFWESLREIDMDKIDIQELRIKYEG